MPTHDEHEPMFISSILIRCTYSRVDPVDGMRPNTNLGPIQISSEGMLKVGDEGSLETALSSMSRPTCEKWTALKDDTMQ